MTAKAEISHEKGEKLPSIVLPTPPAPSRKEKELKDKFQILKKLTERKIRKQKTPCH